MVRPGYVGDLGGYVMRRRKTTPWAAPLGVCAAAMVLTVVVCSLLAGTRPAVAGPTSTPELEEASAPVSGTLAHNRLNTLADLPGYGCAVPAIAENDDASMAAFMGALTDCLDATWQVGLGPAFGRPDRVFWDSPGRSPCGDFPASGASAFYCPVNQGMYIGTSDVVSASGFAPVSMYTIYARVLAHEYAHHVQNRAGILAVVWDLRAGASPARANEVTRRAELQAQCLAGAYFHAGRLAPPVDADQWESALEDSRARGEDAKPERERSHGTGDSYAGWLDRGFTTGAPASCDTWKADRSDVS